MKAVRFTLMTGLLLALSCLPAFAQPSARILYYEGDVQLKKQDSTAWRPLTVYDFKLQVGDSLRTWPQRHEKSLSIHVFSVAHAVPATQQ